MCPGPAATWTPPETSTSELPESVITNCRAGPVCHPAAPGSVAAVFRGSAPAVGGRTLNSAPVAFSMAVAPREFRFSSMSSAWARPSGPVKMRVITTAFRPCATATSRSVFPRQITKKKPTRPMSTNFFVLNLINILQTGNCQRPQAGRTGQGGSSNRRQRIAALLRAIHGDNPGRHHVGIVTDQIRDQFVVDPLGRPAGRRGDRSGIPAG